MIETKIIHLCDAWKYTNIIEKIFFKCCVHYKQIQHSALSITAALPLKEEIFHRGKEAAATVLTHLLTYNKLFVAISINLSLCLSICHYSSN